MRILVTGKSGQVVSALSAVGADLGHEIIAVGRPELELQDRESVLKAVAQAAPDAIISAAAYTAVDKAEDEADLAFAVNAAGAEAVAVAARKLDIPLIHISTDYVFDGKLPHAYVETDATGPTGVYGASKLAGEQAVLAEHGDNSVILRVAWVYSPYGNNFVKTMLRLASDRDEVSVVADQFGNPTSALDIAAGAIQIAENLVNNAAAELRGVFHMTARGEANWAQFAEAIFAASAADGGASASVKAITTAEYPTRAVRPENSRLNCQKIADIHGVRLPNWEESLRATIAKLMPKADELHK
jgi:dTDP-4-dehydrorhamnose reductase